MKIKRNNKSMTIDVSNGKLQKKFATGGHLYEFGTEDFSLKPTSSNINLSEGTQPTTTTTPNGLHYSNAIDLSVATKGNNSTTPNGLPNGAGSMDLGKGKETTPSTPSKNISASNALSGVSGIIQAGVEGYGKNAQINDMSTTKTEARDLGSKPTNDSSFQSLNQNVADTKLMNGVSFRDVRGGSDGQRFMNTLGSTVNGAASGASMGPYGALAGAVIGLGSGVAGWIAGGSKARREQRRVNNLINHANEEYTTNAANQVYNIQNQTMANQGRNYFAQGGHMFAGGTGLPSYPYLSVPQRQWSYSTPYVDYAGRISSFNPYNTGLVDPETGAYQLKPVVIKAKPEPMAARISANAKEEKKAAEQARLEAEEVARVKKNHPMTDSDYDQSSIFNQPTQHPYLYSIAHEGGYSPSQTWQSAKEGMAAALAAPAAIAGAGAIGAAGGIGNVLNAPTIIGGRIASAAGLPAYYGSTAVDAAFAAHGANTLKDLAVKKYNGQSLDANDYANAALAGLEMAPAAPAIVNGMKMIKVPRYLSTDPEYALAAQTPSGQTMYIKPNEYRMLDEAKPGNEAPPEGDGTLASTLKKVKGKTSGLFKREKDPDDDMLRPESSMLGHYLKKTAGGLANAYGKLTDFTPTRLPYINAKRVINTNMNTYLDSDRCYLKKIQNKEPVDLSKMSLFDKMTYEDAQTMYNAGVRWDDTKGTYDIAKTASDASEQSATPKVSPDVAKKYADLLNHRFDFSLKQVSSGDSKSNFMEGFKPGVGKAGQWNPQKKYANPNDDYESFMRSHLPGYLKYISIEDPYTYEPLYSAGKVMLSGHPIDQFMWKHPYLTRLPIGLVAGAAVNGLNNRITNGGWFNTDPNQFETPGVFADKSNASNRVRQITEFASVLGPNWIRGIGYPLIAATGIYDKVAPTPFSINQPSIYKTFDNWNVRHNEDQSYPEKNYFQYLDSAKAHNFQEPYPLTLLNDSTPMVNPQIIDQDEEMNAYKYTGTENDSTAQDTLNQ